MLVGNRILTALAVFPPGLRCGRLTQKVGHIRWRRLVVPQKAAALQLNLQPLVDKGAVIVERRRVICLDATCGIS